MQPSRFRRLSVPDAGAIGSQPTALATAGTVPLRVLVRNIGGAMIFVGASSGDLVGPGGAGNDVAVLPVGASDVYVIMPKQVLYGSGAGAGGQASVATSEALPLT